MGMSRSDAGKLGAAALIRNIATRYYLNPNTCKQCSSVIHLKPNRKLSATKALKFCSHSCAAIYNNPKRQRPIEGNGKCKHCGASLKTGLFCTSKCHAAYRIAIRVQKILESGDAFSGWKCVVGIKRWLISSRGRMCEICKGNSWLGNPMPLILDHIDGNSDDWMLTNLRLVCGNCDMLLPTYKSKNKGSGRAYRRKRYAEGKSY